MDSRLPPDKWVPKYDAVRTLNIPPRPALLMAVQHEIKRNNTNLKKLASLISRDAAISGRLIEVANSASFALAKKSTSVKDALHALGLNECYVIVTQLVTRRMLQNGGMAAARFWDNSEKRALGMRLLAKKTHTVSPELAHNFGLFCDIGIPLLKVKFPSYINTLAAANQASCKSFTGIENTTHGINHSLVGALLAKEWDMGKDIVLAIRLHHEPAVLTQSAMPETTRNLLALHFIVERAIQEYRNQGPGLEWREGGKYTMEFLGLDYMEIEYLCEQAKSCFENPILYS